MALDTKARAAQGTVVQLKSELAQSQHSRTEAKVLHAIALKSTSEFGSYAVVDWMQWFGVPTLAGGPAAVQIPGRFMILHTQEQHIRLYEDQSTTDTADLKMTEDAVAEDTAAFEDITQDCVVCQTKAVEFKAYNRSLSEELKSLTKAVISEKTGDAEYPGQPVSAVIAWRFG